jgi:hypothetical protein
MSMQPCLLIYDIPENSDVRNPSPRLRTRAVRVNLSCWVIQEGDIPYALLNEMRAGGATWHVVRFDPSESGKLIAMAREALIRDIRDAMRRATRSSDNAAQRIEGGENTPETRADYARRIRPIVRRLTRLLRDTIQAAERFGIEGEELSILDAHRSIQAIQEGMQARARAYAEAASAVRALGDHALANSADADQVPAGVLADRIDDEDYGAARQLRKAFAEVA